MGAILDRARAQLAGLVPISFDAPDPEARCPGKDRMAKPQLFGLCHTCARLGGHDMEPAARMSGGFAQCLNFAPHVAETVSRDASVSGDAVSVCAVERIAAPYGLGGQDVGAPCGAVRTKSEAREQQQLRAGLYHHEEGAK